MREGFGQLFELLDPTVLPKNPTQGGAYVTFGGAGYKRFHDVCDSGAECCLVPTGTHDNAMA